MTTNKIDQSNPSKPTQTSWLNRAGNLAMVVGGVAAGAVAFGTGGAAVAAAGGLLYSGYRAFVQKGDDKLVVEATDQGLKLQFNSSSLQMNVEEEEPAKEMNTDGTVISTKYEKAYKITIIDALTSNVSKFKLFGEDILKGFGLAPQTKQTGSIKGALVTGQQLDLRKLFDAIQAISSKFTGNKINAQQTHLLTFNNNSSILLNVSPSAVINNSTAARFLINQGIEAAIEPEQIVANVDTGPLKHTLSTGALATSNSTGSIAPNSETPNETGAQAMPDQTSSTVSQAETPKETRAPATPDLTDTITTTSPSQLTPTAGAPETAKNENKSWWKSVTNWIDSVIGFFRNLVSMFWP